MIEFKYKDYIGRVVELDEDGQFVGEVIGLADDGIMFVGKTPKQLEREFRKSVDEYLAFCKEIDREPQKTCSGRFQVRISPSLHNRAITVAKSRNLSLNDFVLRSIAHGVQEPNHIVNVEG